MQAKNGLIQGVLRVLNKIVTKDIEAEKVKATTFVGSLEGNADTATEASTLRGFTLNNIAHPDELTSGFSCGAYPYNSSADMLNSEFGVLFRNPESLIITYDYDNKKFQIAHPCSSNHLAIRFYNYSAKLWSKWETLALSSHSHSTVTTSANGLMLASDKVKLDSMSVSPFKTVKVSLPSLGTNTYTLANIKVFVSGNGSINDYLEIYIPGLYGTGGYYNTKINSTPPSSIGTSNLSVNLSLSGSTNNGLLTLSSIGSAKTIYIKYDPSVTTITSDYIVE